MYKRFYLLFPVLFLIGDLVVICSSFLASYYLNNGTVILDNIYFFALLFCLLIWAILSLITKDYKIGRSREYSNTFYKAIKSIAIFVSVVSIFWVFFNHQDIDRSFLASMYGQMLVLLTIYRVFTHLLLNRYRRFGGNFRNAVIIGYDNLGFSLYQILKRHQDHGIRCLGIYGDENADKNEYPKSGTISDFFLRNLSEIDFIYVSENIKRPILSQIIRLADENFTKVKLLPNFKTDILKTYSLRLFETISIIDVNSLPLDNLLNRFVKRFFDVVFSLFVIIFLISWLYPLIGMIIFLESKGPIIFKQSRNGKNNKPFWCYKFRTMVINNSADSKWATRNDPRITKFGSFLRKVSLDELPQFFNVLKGEMAIVGPRPLPIKMNEIYRDKVEYYVQRHTSKPGITGLAQSKGYRGEVRDLYHMRSRVKLDRFYLQNWSFSLDIKIIFKTIVVLLKGQETAY